METQNIIDTEKICAVFITMSLNREDLYIKGSMDLIGSLTPLDGPEWEEFLPWQYSESNYVVYWKRVEPANLQDEVCSLVMLTGPQLTEMIDAFNPGWQDLYNVLIP